MAIIRPKTPIIRLPDNTITAPDTKIIIPKATIDTSGPKILSPQLILSNRVALYSKIVTELGIALNNKVKGRITDLADYIANKEVNPDYRFDIETWLKAPSEI